ncbi:Kelch domain-containing protein 10 [Thelohanellus kitauei]|uniref:Kelch domain-containing protein 10 n=1 Tax=Thelohanellus kitauei TaxID=669202 RepID=A0A0C2JGV0_THEKT|nr:Kelch domain-containing protein 10 [Thelohanellus kitauei]
MSGGDEVMEPANRTRHRMTSVGEFLIIYGGFDELSSIVFRELWSFSTASGIWKQYQPPNETENGFFSSTICAEGNIVYIFGGSYESFGHELRNSLISFDISDATWKTLSPHSDEHYPNAPPPMIESCIFYHAKSLYILGGLHSKNYVDSMFKFCLKTSTWSLVEQNGQKPLINFRISGTVFNNKFYTFCFSLIARPGRYKTIYIFNLSTNTWTSRETSPNTQLYPDDRTRESYAFSSKFIYISGGEFCGGYLSDIWRIDLETLEWFQLAETFNTGVYLHCTSIVSESNLYRFGGVRHGSNSLNKFERIRVWPPQNVSSL